MDAMDERLCHVTTPGALTGDRLVGAPFLHCCTEAQLAFVLVRHFAGRSGLLVLRFDQAMVEGHIQWERSEPDQDPFPHLYGALPLHATVATAAPGAWG
jgi:uncharacterized protein (DUF952 family)